ncbi:3011_t:CDS:1, partial [Acaulospora colombiana]
PSNNSFAGYLSVRGLLLQASFYKALSSLEGKGNHLIPSRMMVNEFDRSQDSGIQSPQQSITPERL